MYFQHSPFQQAKLVWWRGAVYDVIVDIRADSTTYKKWFGIELTAENRKALYAPEGVAHGYITLEDESEILYQTSEFYHPEVEDGLRWNDPVFSIKWSDVGVKLIISEKDQNYRLWCKDNILWKRNLYIS